jgi:RNA polymerase-binding transcription factor DksA
MKSAVPRKKRSFKRLSQKEIRKLHLIISMRIAETVETLESMKLDEDAERPNFFTSSPAEVASETQALECSTIQLSNERKLLRNLRDAERRIHMGTYQGICTSCKERIASDRLEALPWTNHCASCQEQNETKRK